MNHTGILIFLSDFEFIGHLQRVMDQTSGTGHRDSPNPLYVKRHGKDGSRKLLVDEEGGGGDIFQGIFNVVFSG